jgi:hypothetical protein
MRECFPWRIGCVYDFRNGQVKSLEIRVGQNSGKYSYRKSPLIFTWLDANESKKLLREIVSSNAGSSMFSLKLNDENSRKVRDLLLDNSFVDLDVAVIRATQNPFQSFPRSSPLHGGEDFVVYPSKIKRGDISVDLFSQDGAEIVSFTNIPINFSSDVSKYLSLISKI